jgi:uncharacterized membrane protein YoaK (UPF0700 family)
VGLALLLSVPLFVLVLGLTKLLAASLEGVGVATLRPLLLLQFLLLAGFMGLGIAAGPQVDPNGVSAILAGMLGVAAMTVQNALVQLSLRGTPATAVMTTNVTRFTLDVAEVVLRRNPARPRRDSEPRAPGRRSSALSPAPRSARPAMPLPA